MEKCRRRRNLLAVVVVAGGPGSNNAAVRRGEAVPRLLPVDAPGRRGDRAVGGG